MLREEASASHIGTMKIISWNLLRLTGASLEDVAALVRGEKPDLLLMQEATEVMNGLPDAVGGHYVRVPLPGRIHGLAAWSPAPLPRPARVLPLQPGAMFERVCLVLDFEAFAVANVHLSHGQVLNRRQLRRIAEILPPRAAVLGDYNLVGPTLLPGFRDVGPREPTHRAGDVVPLRLDRCLVRGLICRRARALGRAASDHRPILVELDVAGAAVRPRRRRSAEALMEDLRRAASRGEARVRGFRLRIDDRMRALQLRLARRRAERAGSDAAGHGERLPTRELNAAPGARSWSSAALPPSAPPTAPGG